MLTLMTLFVTVASTNTTRALAAQPTPAEVVLQQGVDGYTGCTDTYLDLFNSDENHCHDQFLLLSGSPSRSPLLRFDVSGIPSTATVLEAYLELYADPSSGLSPLETGVFGLSKAWIGCEATWNNATATDAWQTPGALGASDAAMLSSDRDLIAGQGWYVLNVTGLVQNWMLDASLNQGVIVRSLDQNYSGLYKFVSIAHPSSELHPRLRVRYVDTGHAPQPYPTRQIAATGVLTFQQGLDGYAGCLDTYIDSNDPEQNLSQNQVLMVRGRMNTSALLHFDLSSLPSHIQVVDARLQMRATDDSSVSDLQLACYTVLRPWKIDEATWSFASVGQAWETSGCQGTGDRTEVPVDREVLHGAGWWQFNVTEMVRQWVEQDSANLGLLLESPDVNLPVAYQFVSTNHQDSTGYPILIVSYAPEPATPTPTPTKTPPQQFVFLPIVFKSR